MRPLLASTWGLIPKRNYLTFLTLHWPFAFFSEKNTKPSCHFHLEYVTLDVTIRCPSQWFILA